MHLTPQERDKLLIFVAAQVAQARRARGLKLNHPEAVALITSQLLELPRDGKGVAEIMSLGRSILTRNDVLEGVGDMIPEVPVEATFPDRTYRPARRCASSRATSKPCSSWPWAARGRFTAAVLWSWERSTIRECDSKACSECNNASSAMFSGRSQNAVALEFS